MIYSVLVCEYNKKSLSRFILDVCSYFRVFHTQMISSCLLFFIDVFYELREQLHDKVDDWSFVDFCNYCWSLDNVLDRFVGKVVK